jgi:hypothetical protein
MALLGSSVDPRLFVQDYSGFTRAADIQGQSMANIGANVGSVIKGLGEDYKDKKQLEAGIKATVTGIESAIKMGKSLGIDVESSLTPYLEKINDPNVSPVEAAAYAQQASNSISNVLNFGMKANKIGIEKERYKQAALMKQAEMQSSKWQSYDKEIVIDGQKVKITGSLDQFGQFKDINNNVYSSVADAFAPVGQTETPLADGAYPDGVPTNGTPMDGPGVLPLDKQNKVPEPPINFDFNQSPSVPGDTKVAPEVVANIEAAGGVSVAKPPALNLPPGASVVTDEQKGEVVTQEEANRRTASGLSVTATPVGQGMVRITSQTGSPKPSPVIESPESKLQTQRLLKLDESLGSLREAGTTASLDIQPLKEITNLLDTNVKTGFGRETLTNAKKILGQDVSNEEQFQAMVGAEAMKNIALTKGAISDREMDYFKTVLSPNQGKSTEGNKKIIEFRIKYAERANKISKTISDLQAQEKNPFEIKKAVDEIISSESLLDNASPEKTEINQAAEDATFLGGY